MPAVAEPDTARPPSPADTPDCQHVDSDGASCTNCATHLIAHTGDPVPDHPNNVELAACTEHVGDLLTFREEVEPTHPNLTEVWEVRAI